MIWRAKRFGRARFVITQGRGLVVLALLISLDGIVPASAQSPASALCMRKCAPDEAVGEDAKRCYCLGGELIENIKTIKSAIASGARPPFLAVWQNYSTYFHDHIGEGLAPDQNRCAITLSLTLGLQP